MEQFDGFTWEGQNGERLRFADLPPHEQRVALIAAGALIRGGVERSKQQGIEEVTVIEQVL
jgi:hypothetical protein